MNDLDDEQLRALIEAVRQAKSAEKRRMALNALLRKLQKLPGILKSSHQDYPEALNLTWEWVCRNIDKFYADDKNVAENLKHWLNGYLYWRIHDLYSPDEKYIKLGSEKIKVGFIPIDPPHSRENDGGSDTMVDRLAKPEDQMGNSFLSLIDRQIQEAQTEERRNLAQKIATYIKQDPDQRLQRCHPKGKPRCNAQFLAMRLCLQDPPATQTSLSEELQIPHQTLVSHWKYACRKLLNKIIQELSDEP
jgi:hypothetical protein